MPNYLKLKNPGDTHMMTVASCAKATTGSYPGIVFTGEDGTAVEVPEKSADRQLARLNLTYQSVVGRGITIFRAPNNEVPSKPYWNIELFGDSEPFDDEPMGYGGDEQETGAPPAPRAPARSSAAPARQNAPQPNVAASRESKRAEMEAFYLALFDRVHDHHSQLIAGEPSLESVNSATSSIFIGMQKAGLV